MASLVSKLEIHRLQIDRSYDDLSQKYQHTDLRHDGFLLDLITS